MYSNKTNDCFSVRKSLRIIKRSEIAEYFSMAEAIDAMSNAFSSLSSGKSFVPKRYVTNSQDGNLTFLLKPAFINSKKSSSIKILSQKNNNYIKGIPTILGIVLLIDNITGEILSIMDGEYLTALRTGAASGLATKLLAKKSAKSMALFGCGSQGKAQLLAVNEVRNLEKVWIFDRSQETAELFIEEMKGKIKSDLEFTADLDFLKDADIICTATNSKKPLFLNEHVKKGTHINAIGSYKPEMQELDPELVYSSRIYLDDKENCLKESGDLLDALNCSPRGNSFVVGEIGDLVLNKICGRTSQEEITVFKSVGNAIQDLVVAESIYNKSIHSNFGQEIKLYE